jgi:hypothetical protein
MDFIWPVLWRLRHAAETRGGRERRPDIDDGVRVIGDGLWIARHNFSILSDAKLG